MPTATSTTALARDPVLEWVRDNVVGRHATIRTPFGTVPKRYFDYTASGLPFLPIEDAVREHVLPWMANTHTDASAVGGYMTELYDAAKKKVRAALHASDDDAVIFTGQGATGAINKLVRALALTTADRPVVFISKMEHISNDLPWREAMTAVGGELVMIGFDERGRVSVDELTAALDKHKARGLKIGAFSAASNVTGIKNDCDALARAMHAHGGFACFDFAAAAPYVDIDLHPTDPRAQKDAVFISMHKFLGGPQAPGLLVANRALFRSKVPVEPGGGTVVYQSPFDYRYSDDISHREEGGTPNIVGVIRAGLAFDLKHAIGVERIAKVEHQFLARAGARLKHNPKVALLGDDSLPRLGILSLILDEGRLHYNLAARLLSDRWGIQARGGAMCAGAYGAALMEGMSGFSFCGDVDQLGWVRLSFSPATTEEDVDALIDALEELVTDWSRFADDYRLDARTHTWRHQRDAEHAIQNRALRLLTP